VIGQITSALMAILFAVGGCALFFVGANVLLDRTLSSRGHMTDLQRQQRDGLRESIRPWIFIGPAVALLTIFLVYPVFKSLWLSFHDANGESFVGVSNYQWALTDPEFRISIRNNLLWLLVVPTLSTGFGLLIAYMTDRLWWGQIARSLVFLPMAISFVGASVIWKFVYDYRGTQGDQIGLMNAILVAFGLEPQAWISLPFWNNFLLMVILIWIQTGFAMVILGAAIRGVPEDTLEAAQMEGASPMQMLFRIVIPQIVPTIVVVWTTITILVLKVFDIVLAMTNGQWDTEVLANLMFDWMFRGGGDFGRGSTIAVVIMIAVLPIMYWNIKRAREDEQ